MTAAGITIVGASAGSGKTHRLTQEVIRAVGGDGVHAVALEGLFAVTYTRKAHAELAARIRRKLVRKRAFDEAMRLPLAYLGTVHAACLRLIQEFALDAGLSPEVDVLADDRGKLMRQALHAVLSPAQRARLDALSKRLELRYDSRIRRHDWLGPVGDIMDLARANRIGPGDLGAMALRSAESLVALFPEPERDGVALDAALADAMDAALTSLSSTSDSTKKTMDVLLFLDGARQRHADGELAWRDWAKLASLHPSKACERHVDRLREVAARHEAHPRLHEDVREMTRAIFDAAAEGLSGYQAWKRRRRLVDYVDMLDGALVLLDDPRVAAELSARLELAVIDEFQDTSPLQLALFMKVHALAGRSIWVGDRKQCIFEYAGADPRLMDQVASWVERDGGAKDRLLGNYRSRPELVTACSALFAAALEAHGFTRDEVVAVAARDGKGLEDLPPFGLFRLEVSNQGEAAQAVAEGIGRMLATPAETPVIDRVTLSPRPVRAGDIAVLVATNAEAMALADALHARGTRSALAREGLLATPEGTLADSALRWLVDAGDSLAAATIDALTGFEGLSPEPWLEDLLQRSGEPSDLEPSGWRASLARVREDLPVLAPREALDGALVALDAVGLCARWPDPAQRVANLDALRALAAAYEDRCQKEREAATVAGLLRYFDTIREPALQGDELVAADHQHVLADDDAVTVCTYHKAKGLEWPVVILGSLDREERRDAFEVCPETDVLDLDAGAPLAGRWIRYWPWPFGPIEKVPLAAAAARSAEGRRVAEREEKERARLLYGGFTRARDHLVLAARIRSTRGQRVWDTAWLDGLTDGTGAPILGLPLEGEDGAVVSAPIRGGADVRVRLWHLTAGEPARVPAKDSPRWFARPQPRAEERPPYRIVPSAETLGWPEVETLVGRARLGIAERLPVVIRVEASMRLDHEALGNAVHAFLAADVPGLHDEERMERARRLLHAARMTGDVRPEALVAAGDNLRVWVHARWPGAAWLREVPVEGIVDSPDGERRVSGILDLLLATAEGWVIVDHKTFPASAEPAWRKRCKDFLPQLVTYAAVLSRIPGPRVVGCWVHLPVGGGMVEVVLPPMPTAG